jgi:hypothetical protein
MKGGQISLHREDLIWDVRASDQECRRFSSAVTDVNAIHWKELVNDCNRRRRNPAT